MKKYYIVCATESPEDRLELISAESQEELEDKAFEVLIDDFFLEFVNSRAVNAGLMEDFFLDEKGSFFDEMTGRVREGIDDEYIEKCVRKNVLEFFKEQPEYGDLYLEQFFNGKHTDLEFSRNFYKFVFYRCDYTSYIIKEVNI